MLNDMKSVIFDREWVESTDNFELYYMHRELYKQDPDLETMRENHLRYDITVIPPNMLGREYIKTAGHYHPMVEGTELSYPEVYQVLEGEATYLLQKREGERIVDVIVSEAKAGEIAIIPPGYGHVTINNSDQTLKMANWVCDIFSSCYEPVKRYSGAAYYLLEDGFVRNESYADVPDVRY
ncbi:MAG: glucose-6-phosphate isomerase family protein, partial [Candidatus Thorarchaeota archaeon]